MPAGSFDKLLQQVAEKHNSEVNELRDENARLLAELALPSPCGVKDKSYGVLCRAGTSYPAEFSPDSTASTTDKKVSGPHISGESLLLRSAAFPPLNGTSHVGPDADALAAAYTFAFDETDELEQVTMEMALQSDDVPYELPLSYPMYGGREFSGKEYSDILPMPLMSASEKYLTPTWSDPRKDTNVLEEAGRWRPAILGGDEETPQELDDHDELQKVVSVNESTGRESFGSDGFQMPDRLDKDVGRLLSIRSSARGFPADSNLGRWETLIQYAETASFISSLPKTHPVWLHAAEEGAQSCHTGFASLKELVKRSVRPSEAELELQYKSEMNWLSRRMLPFMLHPTCRKRACWDMGGILLLCHDLIFIPFQTFEKGTAGLGDSYANFLSVLDLIGACFWSTDVFVSFLTGFYTTTGFVELTPSIVAKNYLRSWFSMDLLIVTTDWSTMFMGMSSASGYMRLGKTISRIMRVLRLLRFLKMNRAMREAMERINSEYLLQMISLLKTLIFIVVINHYIACCWYAVGTAGVYRDSWPEKFLTNSPGTFDYAYSTSLHWSLTQFTPASMEVVAQNTMERIFTIVVIIMALVAFSSFVSSITAAMTHIRQINARQVAEEASIRQFFAEHKVSHGTATRIWHFVRKNKGAKGKRMKESDVPALKAIPYKLKEDLRAEVMIPVLAAHPFFEELYIRDKAVVDRLCQSPCLSEVTVPVGEELFREQKVATKMVFVACGTLQYIDSPDPGDFRLDDEALGSRVTYVTHGMWACEAALWANRAPLHGPFFAVNGAVQVILIDAEHFQSAVKASSSTDCLPFVCKYSEAFMETFRDSCINAYDETFAARQGSSEFDAAWMIDDPRNCKGSVTNVDFVAAMSSTLLFNEVELASRLTEKTKMLVPSVKDTHRHALLDSMNKMAASGVDSMRPSWIHSMSSISTSNFFSGTR